MILRYSMGGYQSCNNREYLIISQKNKADLNLMILRDGFFRAFKIISFLITFSLIQLYNNSFILVKIL